jgi:hypothetical protein
LFWFDIFGIHQLDPAGASRINTHHFNGLRAIAGLRAYIPGMFARSDASVPDLVSALARERSGAGPVGLFRPVCAAIVPGRGSVLDGKGKAWPSGLRIWLR